mgnify:CR=1 FL=1
MGEGKRSLAYALRFRAPDRTLTVDEVAAARDAAVAAAAVDVHLQIRDAALEHGGEIFLGPNRVTTVA